MRRHGEKISWYLRLEKKGVRVKALEDLPDLSELEQFYLELYNLTGGKASEMVALSSLYGMGNDETFFAIKTIKIIEQGTMHANSNS